MRVITFGTFDLFHVGHLRILRRAKELGSCLIVGVSTDELNKKKKGRYPAYPQDQRREILDGLACVDQTFFEESLEKKAEYVEQYKADILVMGDDWQGKFDFLMPLCKVVYLERTSSISTTQTIEVIRSNGAVYEQHTRAARGMSASPRR